MTLVQLSQDMERVNCLTFFPAAPTFAFFVPLTFFILFLRSFFCFADVFAPRSITPWRARRNLGSYFLAKSIVS